MRPHARPLVSPRGRHSRTAAERRAGARDDRGFRYDQTHRARRMRRPSRSPNAQRSRRESHGGAHRAVDMGALAGASARTRRAGAVGDADVVRRPTVQRPLIVILQLAEIFYSIQGEGAWSGTPAVFV